MAQPPGQTPPWAQKAPLGRHPSWVDTPNAVNERAVCILLECILVSQAVRDGLARVYLFHIPRHLGCKPVTDIINKKCDVKRPFNKGKVQVAVTGIGANLFKDELEKQLNAE